VCVNSERMAIDGDKAWNLGILVVLCGIIGAKVLYVNQRMELLFRPSQRDFQHQHAAGRRSFFRRPVGGVSGSGLVCLET